MAFANKNCSFRDESTGADRFQSRLHRSFVLKGLNLVVRFETQKQHIKAYLSSLTSRAYNVLEVQGWPLYI